MATKSIAWTTGTGNILLTYTGQGNGTIQVASDPNSLGTARSQVITVKTTQGGVVTKNITVSQAACPFPVGDVRNYSYTGTVQSVLLPAGSYKLQCWGAQGGQTNGYGTKNKGGYSEGVLTLTSPTTVYIFVGGQGSTSGNGGWNGGGKSTGYTSYNSNNENGYSYPACGGGATDIALVTSSMSYSGGRTNRSSASLLSRMIVAGGGSGASLGYKEVTTETITWETIYDGYGGRRLGGNSNELIGFWTDTYGINLELGETYRITFSGNDFGTHGNIVGMEGYNSGTWKWQNSTTNGGTIVCKNVTCTYWDIYSYHTIGLDTSNITVKLEKQIITTSTEIVDWDYSNGHAGGGVVGACYNSGTGANCKAGPNYAGTSAGFGYGANLDVTSYRYAGGAGGGGWYGGGTTYNDNGVVYVNYSGGGSGFVNTAANASYRPSGYTGLQLDSGETKDGNTSFPSTSGGNETGHAGNGYARITRIS